MRRSTPTQSLGAFETAESAAISVANFARDAQMSADRATQSGCEGVSVSHAESTSPTPGLSAHTINQLGPMWS